MKTNLKLLTAALALSLGLTAATANAALVSRLGGLAVYDTDFNITWLANANANGAMNWVTANAWASGLTVDGISGWRLPTTLQPDASCGTQGSSGSRGYNCTGSEMGHLFYTELGGVANQSITTTHNASYGLFNNVQSANYWSDTEYAPYAPGGAWIFYFGWGTQGTDNKRDPLFALAVRPGDVGAVPIPAAEWLFGPGLLGLVGMARRRR